MLVVAFVIQVLILLVVMLDEKQKMMEYLYLFVHMEYLILDQYEEFVRSINQLDIILNKRTVLDVLCVLSLIKPSTAPMVNSLIRCVFGRRKSYDGDDDDFIVIN